MDMMKSGQIIAYPKIYPIVVPTFFLLGTLYYIMPQTQPNLSFPIKPVHTLLVAFALLAIAVILFFCSIPVSYEDRHPETSEGAGFFHSPLMCI